MVDKSPSHLETTRDLDEIKRSLQKYATEEAIAETANILAQFGSALALCSLKDNKFGLCVVDINTGQVIPLSVAGKSNIEYFILNGSNSTFLKDKTREKSGSTNLTPHIFSALQEAFKQYERECLDVSTEIETQTDRALDMLQIMEVIEDREQVTIHEFKESSLTPGYFIIVLPQALSIVTWNIYENGKAATQYPESLQWTQHIGALLVVPAAMTSQERKDLEDLVGEKMHEENYLQGTVKVASIDQYLLNNWENAIQTNESVVVSDLATEDDAPEETNEFEDLEALLVDVQAYFDEILADKPIKLERSPQFINQGVKLPDFTFAPRDTSVSHTSHPLCSMFGWQRKREKGVDRKSAIPYDSVGGFVLVPNEKEPGWVERRKEIQRAAGNALRQYSPFPRSANILTVDRDLLNFWKERGSPFASPEEVMDAFKDTPSKKQADYGVWYWRQREEPPRVEVDWWEPNIGSHIGSPQLRIRVIWDETYADAFMIDIGWIFSRWKSKGFLDFPQPQDGIGDFLERKVFRPITRLYRTDLLMFSVDNKVLSNVLAHVDSTTVSYSISNFILLELYHRLGEDGLDSLLTLSEKTAKYYAALKTEGTIGKLFQYLRFCEKIVYANKTIYWGLGITHAHQDHTIGSSLVRKAVPRILTPITHTLLETDFLTSHRYTIAETAYYRKYDEAKIGNAWQVEAFPFIHMEDSSRLEIAPGFYITAYEGHHSVPGEVGFIWEYWHKGKLVSSGCYGGDDKDGHFFRRVQEHVKEYGPVDVAFIEGTNDERTTKAGAFTNRWDVKRSFENFFENNQDQNVVVVDMIKNSIERLFDLILIAKQANRTVALSPRILYRIQKLGIDLQDKIEGKVTCSTESEREFVDIIKQLLEWIYNHDFILCWKRDMRKYDPYEREMFATFGTVSTDDLSLCSVSQATDKKYIVLREFGEDERKLKGIASKTKIPWIMSTYAAYDRQAKTDAEIREEFAEQNNFEIIRGFHTSGHGVQVKRDHPYARGGIAEEASKCGFDEVVVVHVQNGRDYISNEVLPSYKGFRKTWIHASVSHPNPKIVPRKQFERFPKLKKVSTIA